jgi:hypothetical protein
MSFLRSKQLLIKQCGSYLKILCLEIRVKYLGHLQTGVIMKCPGLQQFLLLKFPSLSACKRLSTFWQMYLLLWPLSVGSGEKKSIGALQFRQMASLCSPLFQNWNAVLLAEGSLGTTRICCRYVSPGNTKGGSITVPLTSCLTGLESAVWQLTIFVFICKTD